MPNKASQIPRSWFQPVKNTRHLPAANSVCASAPAPSAASTKPPNLANTLSKQGKRKRDTKRDTKAWVDWSDTALDADVFDQLPCDVQADVRKQVALAKKSSTKRDSGKHAKMARNSGGTLSVASFFKRQGKLTGDTEAGNAVPAGAHSTTPVSIQLHSTMPVSIQLAGQHSTTPVSTPVSTPISIQLTDIDQDVFASLPPEIQQEFRDHFKNLSAPADV